MFNNALLELAKWRTREELQKEAFTPPQPGGDPSQGGMPPDPSQGGMPPGADPSQGGMPPDPSQMGGAPPPGMPPGMPPGGDPSQGAPPQPDPSQGGGGGGIDQTEVIRSILQQELAKFAPQGGGGGAGGSGGNKPARPDLNTIAMDVFQIKKMLTHLFNMQDIPLPPEIIDGPNRDPQTGAQLPPNTPGSTSDPSQQSQPAQSGNQQQSAIQPIAPMGAAGPNVKQSSYLFDVGRPTNDNTKSGFVAIKNKAAAMAKLAKSLRENEVR